MSLTISGQKLTKHGKPIIDDNGLPVYNASVDKRIKVMKDIVVRRIRIEKKTTEAIKRIKVKSFNSFVIAAIYEKLDRDFKIKQNCPF